MFSFQHLVRVHAFKSFMAAPAPGGVPPVAPAILAAPVPAAHFRFTLVVGGAGGMKFWSTPRANGMVKSMSFLDWTKPPPPAEFQVPALQVQWAALTGCGSNGDAASVLYGILRG